MKQDLHKETDFSWLMHRIYAHGKELGHYRVDNWPFIGDKSIRIDALESAINCLEGMVGDGTEAECYEELDKVKNHYYYKGYWKALLWVMDMSLKRKKGVSDDE